MEAISTLETIPKPFSADCLQELLADPALSAADGRLTRFAPEPALAVLVQELRRAAAKT